MTVLTPDQQTQLRNFAEEADRLADWPTASWQQLCAAGVTARSIPRVFGGTAMSPVKLLEGMEEIGSCCLTTAFILSQREAAVRHLLRGPEPIQQRYLPGLASGEIFATVGLSQLTTSRQHLGPALRATAMKTGAYQLDGEIPWVTGADQADVIVAGATLANGTQLLVAIPASKLEGCIAAPLTLAAVTGSRTSLIHCRELVVSPDEILAGPTENVMGKLGGGGLDTSCLAIALASAATRFIQQEAERRVELTSIAERYNAAVIENRRRLHALAESNLDPCEILELRTSCTKLVLRATQAALMVAKGNGFVAPHPAQRWARQATFFLVWSCPRPVTEGVLSDLSDW